MNSIYLSLLQLHVPTTDVMKLHHVCNALSTSPGQEFKSVIDHIQMVNIPYPQARDMFHAKDAQLRVARDFKRSEDAITARLKIAQVKKDTKVICTYCKRKGHKGAQCWYKEPCSVCNKSGHSDGYCTGSKTAKKSGATTTNTTVNDRFLNNKTSDYSSSSVLCTFHPEHTLHDTKVAEDILDGGNCTVATNQMKILDIIPGEVSDQHQLRVTVVLASLISKRTSLLWRIILDSGASSHMLPYDIMLINTRSAQGEVIMGDENSRLPIEGMGDTNISYISDVLYVPALTVGVFSVCAFDKKHYTTVFSDGVGIVYDQNDSIVLTATLTSNGLYEVDMLYLDYLCGVSSRILYCTESSPQSCQTSSCEHCNGIVKRLERVITSETVDTLFQGETNHNPTASVGCACIHKLMHVCNDTDRRGQPFQGSGVHVNRARCFTATESVLQLNPLEILHSEWGHLGEHNIKRALRDKIVQ